MKNINLLIIILSVISSINLAKADISPEGNIIPGSVIRADDFNQIFNSLKLKLLEHNYEVQFDEFFPGEPISSGKINQQLNKIPLFIDDSQRANLLASIGSGNLNAIFNYLDTAVLSYESILEKFADNYDESCHCLKNIPYLGTHTWRIDGNPIPAEGEDIWLGQHHLDIYLPNGSPNGKVVFYTHEMGNNKNMETGTGVSIIPTRENLRNLGYYFISVEFKHPSLDGGTDGYDISRAYSFIRKQFYDFGLSHPDDFYSLSYSKGSLVLASILDMNNLSFDRFGKHTFNKIYAYEAQITYQFNAYYDLFIQKSNCLFVIPPLQCFTNVNDTAQALIGMSLFYPTNIIDTYLNFNRYPLIGNVLDSNSTRVPKIRMGYVLSAKNSLEVPNGLTIGQTDINYFLHNPRSINVFCNKYLTAIGETDNIPCLIGPNSAGTCPIPTDIERMCSGMTGINNPTAVSNEVITFFEDL